MTLIQRGQLIFRFVGLFKTSPVGLLGGTSPSQGALPNVA